MIILTDSKDYPKEHRRAVIAVGNFDGVHIGHAALLAEAERIAALRSAKKAVYTFSPHPANVIAKGFAPRLLQTFEQKMAVLDSMGVDICIAEKFTPEFASIHSRKFFEEIVLERISPAAIVVGYNFTFGLHREGTAETLREYGKSAGIEVSVIDPQSLDGVAISSTNIRNLLFNGDVAEAERMLGRPYSIIGKVISGKGIGGKLGAHTANLDPENEIIPKNGIYITETKVFDQGDGKAIPSITSIGNNPTFGGGEFAIETHLLIPDVNLLGKRIEVGFLERIGDQVAFHNVEELKKKIAEDIAAAGRFHSSRKV